MSRDWKNRNAPPVSDEYSTRTPSSKKDTKKWCKGVEGRKHKEVVVLNPQVVSMIDRANKKAGGPYCTPIDGKKPLWSHCAHQVVCENCKKVLTSYGVGVCPTTGERIREKTK